MIFAPNHCWKLLVTSATLLVTKLIAMSVFFLQPCDRDHRLCIVSSAPRRCQHISSASSPSSSARRGSNRREGAEAAKAQETSLSPLKWQSISLQEASDAFSSKHDQLGQMQLLADGIPMLVKLMHDQLNEGILAKRFLLHITCFPETADELASPCDSFGGRRLAPSSRRCSW